jgi:phosphoribosylformimino-5-aminoimidazole carboxamide ribotide isomerase
MVDAGARWLHVVDMALALDRRHANVGVVSDIVAAAPGARVQASGGIIDEHDARSYLGAGATRVVLGSAGLADAQEAERLLERHRSEVVVGLEVADGRIRSRGVPPVELDLMSTIGWATAVGAAAFLVTATARVGGLAGPDEGLIRRVVRSGRPVLAAGGIASVADLGTVRDAGGVGAVVGRAVLDGRLDVALALEWAATA